MAGYGAYTQLAPSGFGTTISTTGTATADRTDTIVVGGRTLSVPRSLAARRAGPVGTIDLIVPIDDRPGGRLERVLLLRLSPRDGAADPADRPQGLYARFLTSDVWTNPGGLVSRRFRAHSPYENEELYLAPPDGKRFAARCPRMDRAETVAGLCIAEFRQGDIDILVSFSHRRLPDWQIIERRLQETFATLGLR